MRDAPDPSVTHLLRAWRAGKDEALEQLLPLVYQELRRLARRELRGERRDHTLETAALVNEAYMRLVDAEVPWQDRAHFFAIAARTMRRILVDHARARRREKRGGGVTVMQLDREYAAAGASIPDVVMVDEALTRLGAVDEPLERLVELHYFGGLTYREISTVAEVSEATVHRQLRLAKAWLRRELSG